MSDALDRKPFKIIWPSRRDEVALMKELECPRTVPWSIVEPHEAQALHFHSQTLKRLDERGGLAPCELAAVLLDTDYYKLWGWNTGSPTHRLDHIRRSVLKLKEVLTRNSSKDTQHE